MKKKKMALSAFWKLVENIKEVVNNYWSSEKTTFSRTTRKIHKNNSKVYATHQKLMM